MFVDGLRFVYSLQFYRGIFYEYNDELLVTRTHSFYLATADEDLFQPYNALFLLHLFMS